MRYSIPQFIDVEDKIFGPLTARQFAYLTGGAGLAYVLYKLLPSILGVLAGAAMAGFGIALAFVKVNEKPLLNTIEAMFNYLTKAKLYQWRQEKVLRKTDTDQFKMNTETRKQAIPTITASKLHDISWGLDVLDKDK